MNESQVAVAEQRLRDALQARAAALKAGRVEVALFEGVAEAQRALAAAKGEEYAIPVDVGFVPEAAVSGAVLLQTEDAAFITFSAMRKTTDGRLESAGRALVELEDCEITKFGYPNDEARSGHLLAERGMDTYGVFEVVGSRWVAANTEQNRKVFPNTPDSALRHFVFTFHDSTFECVARGLRPTLTTKPLDGVLSGLIATTSNG